MTVHQNDIHTKVVSAWEEKNTKALTSEQLVQVFGSAIRAIEQRCLITLSSITVKVVVDRVLHESTEKFSILSKVSIESAGLDFSALLKMGVDEKTEELRKALHYLVVELLAVLGNITANILTVSLHKELMSVTRESALEVSNLHVLQAKKSVKTNRGES